MPSYSWYGMCPYCVFVTKSVLLAINIFTLKFCLRLFCRICIWTSSASVLEDLKGDSVSLS